MDNSNSSFPNTQSNTPVNDNKQNPVIDYNSIQPQSNTLGVISDTSVPSSTPMEKSMVDALAGVPSSSEVQSTSPNLQPSIGNVSPVEGKPLDTLSTLGDLNTVRTTTVPETSSAAAAESPAPAFDTSSTPVETQASPFDTTVPTMDTAVAPTLDMSSTPVETSTPTMETAEAPAVDTPVETQASPFETTAFSAPSSIDTSLNLNQPQSSSIEEVSAPAEDVVNTLGESEKEDDSNNTVIIILVVIIILLLAGIGYFGYQIFFA